MSDSREENIKNILFEIESNKNDDDSDTEIGDDFELQQGGEDELIDEGRYSSDSDEMNELDMKILRQLQMRKQKREKYRQHQSSSRKLSKFPSDFTNDKFASSLPEFSDAEKNTLNKIRYDIHRSLYKLKKKNKLERLNEFPITYNKYLDSPISNSMLIKLKSDIIKRGFGCEISNEREHTVKHKSKGVILSIIIH